MGFKTLVAAATLSVTVGGAASAATLVDFTDIATWGQGTTSASYGSLGVSIAASGFIRQTGNDPQGAAVAPLAGGSDGLGIGDDEISFGESLTVTFSKKVRVIALYYLDLFLAKDGSDEEEAVATFDSGVDSTVALTSNGNEPGFVVKSGISFNTTAVTFTSAITNDARGNPDYALAAIEVAAIPVPAAGWLFLSALGGMGLLARRRTA